MNFKCYYYYFLLFDNSKRQDGLIETSEKKQEKHRENLSDLQRQFQQQQVKAAARA